MLKVPQQQYIKFLRETEGFSIREISHQMWIHRRPLAFVIFLLLAPLYFAH